MTRAVEAGIAAAVMLAAWMYTAAATEIQNPYFHPPHATEIQNPYFHPPQRSGSPSSSGLRSISVRYRRPRSKSSRAGEGRRRSSLIDG
jgi:hypothetical protein